MRRVITGAALIIASLLTSCVVPIPLEGEEQTFNPPRFLRDFCLPGYVLSVVVDSEEYETIKLVVQDLDVNDGIEFRIFKDYYQCSSSSEPSDCHMKLITEGEIPPTGGDPNSEYGYDVSTYTYPLKKSLLCSSSSGDTLGSSHLIEVVVTDAFLRDSTRWPYWRNSIGGSDVWSFIVECVSGGVKSKLPDPEGDESGDSD